MNNIDEIRQLLEQLFSSQEIIQAVLSNPFQVAETLKITLRLLPIKGQDCYQLSEHRSQNILHRNLSAKETVVWFHAHFTGYKQIHVYTKEADYHLLINKKGGMTLLKKTASKKGLVLQHNRSKDYLLKEGQSIPFLVTLGIMNEQGKVFANKRDKFRQINRFVEMIEDILPQLDLTKTLKIIDFGCGKAYLTFALYHFLKSRECKLSIIGLDLKKEVIQQCNTLSETLGYEKELNFILGDIQHYANDGDVDMVVSLHACNTATDSAIEKAVLWNAKVILAVPCCQHELSSQIQQDLLTPLLKHGILKERFAALVTDAARAQLLDILGYQTQILEFIDLEHTPKNLLIRAIKREHRHPAQEQKSLNDYQKFKKHLEIHPFLENCFFCP